MVKYKAILLRAISTLPISTSELNIIATWKRIQENFGAQKMPTVLFLPNNYGNHTALDVLIKILYWY